MIWLGLGLGLVISCDSVSFLSPPFFYPYISTGYTPDNPKPYGVTNFEK